VRHAAVLLQDGAVFVAGGSAATYLNSTEVWDPDTDLDGVPDRYEIAPGCLGAPLAGAPGPRRQMTLPCDPDTDGDGFLDKPATSLDHSIANTDPAVDNCPEVANASQLNSDGNFISLSAWSRPFNDTTRAMSDGRGDACDVDDDNDGLADGVETVLPGPPCTPASAPLDSLLADSDGDRVVDGAECVLGTDPAKQASYPFVVLAGDTDGDGLTDALEATLASNPHSIDTDMDGVLDGVEFRAYGSSLLLANSDGDVCADGKEAASVNNDNAVNSLDLVIVAQAFGSSSAPFYVPDFDIDRNGSINSIDLQLVARQFGPC
jgi:hypothetical protein